MTAAPPADTAAPEPAAPEPAPALSALTLRTIFRTWWPLAASWLLMSFEGPAISAVLARLDDPELNLAAYGGLVLPLCFIIEAPIIMLLSASTALSRDPVSYRLMQRFMHGVSAALTILHALLAFTPLYYVAARDIIGVPDAVVEAGRLGMMLSLPWTWAIAYRRFNQGVLIRFGRALNVGTGTVVRLGAELCVLAAGYLLGTIRGIGVAALTLVLGVTAEAVYAGFKVRPVLRLDLARALPVAPILTWRRLLAFYIPLSLTSVLLFLANPLVSAGLSRMPEPLLSLAVWPVVGSIGFILRAFGIGFSEVVIALIDRPGALPALRRFALLLVAGSLGIFLVIWAPPLRSFWFETLLGLSPRLAPLAGGYLWLMIPLPILAVLQSLFQGMIMHGRHTRAITESVLVFLGASVVVLVAGVIWGQMVGLPVGLVALTSGEAVRTGWLWWRSRGVRDSLKAAGAAAA